MKLERRTLAPSYAGYDSGTMVAAALERIVHGPATPPGQDTLDPFDGMLVFAALFVGGPVGLWLAVRAGASHHAARSAALSLAFAVPAIMCGQLVLSAAGLDAPWQVSR